MSFVKTVPEELAAAAAKLEAIVSSLSAQHAGAAAATTTIAPAAADPVSLKQAALFSTYGTQYQATATQASTEQQQYVSTLNQSSGTYAATEASNSAQQSLDPASLINQLYNFLSNGNGLFNPSSGGTTIVMDEMGNFASGYSDTIGMGGGGLLAAVSAPSDAGADLAGLAGATDLAGTTTPAAGSGLAGMAGMGAMPVAAGVGQATMVGKLSVPPSWAGTVTTVSSTAPMGLPTAGWTAAAPQAGPGTLIPGMPGMGAAARNSAGFGAPRYGVKPIVMPKPTAV